MFLLLISLLYAEPVITKTGDVQEGVFRKILHRYRLLPSVQKERNVVDHPFRQRETPSVLVSIFDTTYLAVVKEGYVSLDLNEDGIIQAEESEKLNKEKGIWKANLQLRRRYKNHVLPISLVMISTNPKKNLGLFTDMMRKGSAPNGAHFFLHSEAGRFDHPNARLILDCDDDGIGDRRDSLCVARVRDGGISIDGRVWDFSIDPAGETVTWRDRGQALLQKGQRPPAFSKRDWKGKSQNIDRYLGTKVLLDFWATWCAPCLRDHKKLPRISQQHNLQVLGFAQNSKKDLRKYLRKTHLTWPQILISENDPILQTFQVSSLPLYFLIDERGRFLAKGSLQHIESVLQSHK